MAQNLFEELQAKKQRLVAMTEKAVKDGWITAEKQHELLDKLEKDVLTIGVIGQMKCGKSTFLNAFVFEDDILPAATTPMTAALTVITYGEKERIVAEFYTKDEWEEQKLTASHSSEGVNESEKLKIEAAQELVGKAEKLGSSLDAYLGKKQEDKFANLIEYVGADGKYVSITKLVTIYYPKEYLKGVEIVDTPGFNDPIVSREERTKAFLQKADVVLLMLYAGRAFDATDKVILFQNVRQCGIGKVVIGINKYDVEAQKNKSEKEIKDFVKQEINKSCEEREDDSLSEMLKDVEPILFSAEMALLAKLPMRKITSNEIYKSHWDRYCREMLDEGTQKQMWEKSYVDKLESAIKRLIENEKEEILFAKPKNAIKSAGNKKKEEIENALRVNKEMIENLQIPDNELDKKRDTLVRTERRLNKKINFLGNDIDENLKEIVKKGEYELEDEVDRTCGTMRHIVEDWKRFKSIDDVKIKLDREKQRLVTRTLKRCVQKLSNEARKRIKSSVKDFVNDASELINSYVTDFNAVDFEKSLNSKIQLEVDNAEMFTYNNSKSDKDWLDVVGELFYNLLNRNTFGLLGAIRQGIRGLDHNENQRKLLVQIDSINNSFDPHPYLESIYQKKDDVISSVNQSIISGIIEPLKQQIDDIRSNAASKAEKLAEAKKTVETLQTQKADIERQIADMEKISF